MKNTSKYRKQTFVAFVFGLLGSPAWAGVDQQLLECQSQEDAPSIRIFMNHPAKAEVTMPNGYVRQLDIIGLNTCFICRGHPQLLVTLKGKTIEYFSAFLTTCSEDEENFCVSPKSYARSFGGTCSIQQEIPIRTIYQSLSAPEGYSGDNFPDQPTWPAEGKGPSSFQWKKSD